MSYVLETKGRRLIFVCKVTVNAYVAEDICNEIKQTLEANPALKQIVLNLENAHQIEFEVLRVFSTVAMNLRKKEMAFYVLGVPNKTRQLIHQAGIEGLLIPATLVEEIPTLPGDVAAKPSSGINVAFINPFVEGTMNTLSVQCGISCTPGKPMTKEKFVGKDSFVIAGVIGISSPKFCGSIAILFPNETFLKIMGKMLGEEYPEITKDLEDGAAELLNIIYGHAKRVLGEQGHTIDRALPTVIRGDKINLRHMTKSAAIVLPFGTEMGTFIIEIGADQSE